MEKTLTPGINHIEFWVSDLFAAMKFYNSFLTLIGWKQISGASFSNGAMVIYFVERKNDIKTASLGMRHLCFQAVEKNQVDQVYDALSAEGAAFIRGPIAMPYSEQYYTVDFYDPDGQILEVAYTPYPTLG